MILGTVIEWEALLDTVLVSLGAGVGVTLAYSLAVFGAIRFVDLRRDERTLAAASAALLVAVMGVVCVAAVVLGIVVMTSK